MDEAPQDSATSGRSGLDLSPSFRARLKESLMTHGWSQDQFLVVAASEDERLDGQIIQGRHRVLCISELLHEGHKFNTGHILIRREEVRTADELRARRASYETAAALCKDPKLSRKWVATNLNPLIEKKASEGQTKILAYLHESGFQNDSVALEMIDVVLDKLAAKAKKRQKNRSGITTPGQGAAMPPHLKDPASWGQQAGAATVDDSSTSFLRTIEHGCDYCRRTNKIALNVAVGNREIVRLEVAQAVVQK